MINKKYFDRLVREMKKTDCEAVLVAPSQELKFLIGHSPSAGARFEGLFVLRDGQYFHICPLLSEEEMGEILEPALVHGWSDGEGYLPTVEACARKYDLYAKTIAVNQFARAFHILEIAEKGIMQFQSGKNMMEEMRIIKDEEEMENLRVASSYADEVFSELLTFIEPGMTEKDIKQKIQDAFSKKGVQGGGLVAVGPNASMPHYNRDDRVIKEKDLVLMDFGCSYKGMMSDITRTVFVGEVSKKQRQVYEIVKNANEVAIEAIAVGKRACDIDKVARDIIENAGYGDYFLSRLGHGIGYVGHEAPDIKGSNTRRLETGMAFSIEPGIYLPKDFGVRIEDIVLMGPAGVEVLNSAPKEIIVL